MKPLAVAVGIAQNSICDNGNPLLSIIVDAVVEEVAAALEEEDAATEEESRIFVLNLTRFGEGPLAVGRGWNYGRFKED